MITCEKCDKLDECHMEYELHFIYPKLNNISVLIKSQNEMEKTCGTNRGNEKHIGSHARVVNIPASYSGRPGFKSRLVERLS
jgi:hypothetical protein